MALRIKYKLQIELNMEDVLRVPSGLLGILWLLQTLSLVFCASHPKCQRVAAVLGCLHYLLFFCSC